MLPLLAVRSPSTLVRLTPPPALPVVDRASKAASSVPVSRLRMAPLLTTEAVLTVKVPKFAPVIPTPPVSPTFSPWRALFWARTTP